MEDGHKFCRKGYGFLLKMCIKAVLPSLQSETKLNHTTHAISVLFLRCFLLAGRSTASNILPWLRSYFQKLIIRGWNKNVLGGVYLAPKSALLHRLHLHLASEMYSCFCWHYTIQLVSPQLMILKAQNCIFFGCVLRSCQCPYW